MITSKVIILPESRTIRDCTHDTRDVISYRKYHQRNQQAVASSQPSGKGYDMRHTPYGYKIIDGKAVVDEEKAAQVRKICENYLGGMSFINAAADVGLTMTHCEVKHMIQNSRYLGDSFYPAIITEETARRIEAERVRRAKALGRDNRGRKKQPKPTIYKNFSIPRVPEKYQDPIKQAEYAYSLIQSEVSG